MSARPTWGPTLIVVAVASTASADPYRLRADALATTAAPAGLLVLDGGARLRAGWSAEALVWVAGDRTPGETTGGDVLVIALRGQTEDGRLGGQIGRFVSSLGALRPVHVDGVGARVRLPRRFDVEASAGAPVPPTLLGNGRAWDWYAAARVARRLGDTGSVGLAYGHRRDAGRLAYEELGVDAGAQLDRRYDAGGRVAYDLTKAGIAEVGLVASRRGRAVRTEVYARHRSPSSLLPATSLFSVIGDVPSQRVGTVITWRAAPRLDVIADVAARRIDDAFGEELVGRARLRLDDRGVSVVSGELRRAGGGDFAWTGARAAARVSIRRNVVLSSELELVIRDDGDDRGRVWPWGLVAASWDRASWSAALAVEASASPQHRYRVDGLVSISRRWGSTR